MAIIHTENKENGMVFKSFYSNRLVREALMGREMYEGDERFALDLLAADIRDGRVHMATSLLDLTVGELVRETRFAKAAAKDRRLS